MLDRYEPGSDLTIMNTFYQYPKTDQETGKRIDDLLGIVYKDNKTGKKGYEIIHKPEYTFYITKDGVDLGYNRLFIEKDIVEPVTVKYTNLEKKIAELTGNEDFYKQCREMRDRDSIKKLHMLPNVFYSDTNIEDFYRFQFGNKFTNNINKITKGFFDIEVDTRYMSKDFVMLGECPVNAIGFHDEEHDIIIEYLLRNENNPLIQKFEDEYHSGAFNETQIKKFIETNIGGSKYMNRYKLNNTKIDIKFFDNEIELLYSFFQQVHVYEPDFMLSWNGSAFDLAYIIERCYALGVTPEEIMCNKDWEVKIVKNYIDTRHLNEFAERGDFTVISGTTTWIDQMIQFASRRKSKIGSFKSFKLDDIAYDTAKVHKLDYHHITSDIAMLPWLDYKTFVLYNIFDVIAQKCIEIKSQDLEYIFAKCIINNTVYRKGHRQTVYLINRMAKEFYKLGYIIGNNANKLNEKPADKFLGAMVSDPNNTTDYSKIKINGIPIMVCNNLQDYDYTSLYPNIILEFNIAPNIQIGRIEIPNKVYSNENANLEEKYSRGGEFIENLVSDNIIEFCHRWFHLAGFKEFLEDWKEYDNIYHKTFGKPGNYRAYRCDGNRIIITPVMDVSDQKTIKPIEFGRPRYNPIVSFSTRDSIKGAQA